MNAIRTLTAREIECRVSPVKGYEGLYVVTSEGSVIGLKSGKTLKTSDVRGYLRVKLYKNAQPRMFSIHRLVADAFIPNRENKSQVNHKDGNKGNNNVENLEWATQSENQIHAYKTGLNTTAHAIAATKKHVVQSTTDGQPLKVWESLSEASRQTGIPVGNITHCCKGRIRHAGGYKWDYSEF